MSPTEHARERIGRAIRAERKSRSLSIEAAAKAGGIGHMTWRKIEHGGSVHDQSYYAIDRAFGWQSGHTLATVNEDGAELTPAPSARDDPAPSTREKAQRWATREEILAMPRDEDGPSSDAFYTILEQIDSVSLPELRAVKSVVEVRLRERTDILDNVKNRINNIDWRVPQFRVEFMKATAPEVGDEYQHAYGEYMNAWANMQEIARLTHECETKRAANVPELQKLWERAESAGQELDDAVQRFNEAEESAVKNQGNEHNKIERE